MKSSRDKHRRRRRASLGATLLIAMTAAASQQGKDAGGISQPATSRPPTAAAGKNAEDKIDSIALERLMRARINVKKADLFSAKSWYVPPPPPPPAPPPPPSAPPLPFSFLGKAQEPDGKLTIFLAGDNRVYLVSQGETIDNTYHVDGIEDGKLALTYLPLQIKQFLDMGEAP